VGTVEAIAAAGGGVWEFYRDERGVAVVRHEIRRAGNTPGEQALILAEVKRLLRAAVDGRLKPYLDIKNIHRNPLLYELRWRIGDQYIPARLWRLYFGWHSNQGPLRLGLKFGEKPWGKRGGKVQDDHIDEAGGRYRVWLQRSLSG
jgi:hypothetical protein